VYYDNISSPSTDDDARRSPPARRRRGGDTPPGGHGQHCPRAGRVSLPDSSAVQVLINEYGKRFAGVRYHDKEDGGRHLTAVDDAEERSHEWR
jgi:hypothetical protein